jgi:biotin transporter BioY
MAVISGTFSDLAYKKQTKKNTIDKKGLVLIIVGLFLATIAEYAIGIPFLKFNLDVTWTKAFSIAAIPFIPGDILKIVVVTLLTNIFFVKIREYFAYSEE